jgi:hypothetical protein
MQMINTRYYHGRFWDKNLGLKMPPWKAFLNKKKSLNI